MTEATSEQPKKKRGRPRKTPEQREATKEAAQIQKEIVEKIVEIIKYVPEPRLSDWDLYKALKDRNFPQGGVGHFMESPNSSESVYIPHVSEVYQYFIADPFTWDRMRDAIVRAYLELQ